MLFIRIPSSMRGWKAGFGWTAETIGVVVASLQVASRVHYWTSSSEKKATEAFLAELREAGAPMDGWPLKAKDATPLGMLLAFAHREARVRTELPDALLEWLNEGPELELHC